MTKITDDKGRSMTERILDAHKENCRQTKKEIAEALGTSEAYVCYIFQTYGIYVGKQQTASSRHTPTCGKMRGAVKFASSAKRVETCQHWYLQEGQLYQCGLPTKGHTYCADCEHERSHAPTGSRYSQYSGLALNFSRKSGRAA